MIVDNSLESLLERFLPLQRWFGAKDRHIERVEITQSTTLKKDWPGLVQIIASVFFEDGNSDSYQILIGLRPHAQPLDFLEGTAPIIGEVETEQGPAIGYEALRDPDLAMALLSEVAPQEHADLARPVTSEQSNTSLIFDDRMILKIFRQLSPSPSPEVEISSMLWRLGFEQIPEPLGHWRMDQTDLAVLQRYLPGGSEGWALALTSLRDLFRAKGAPHEAGGDFAGEASRLGEMTARLHIALAKAFGKKPGDPDTWASMMEAQLQEVHEIPQRERLIEIFEGLRDVDDPGPAIRTHGDYHLGQVLRTDEGWFVLDFEGEPARDPEERKVPSSPIKDVAAMLRSFHYAASAALRESDEDLKNLADAWEQRNRDSFLEGYIAVAHGGGLLPSDVGSLEVILEAFELDKAIYEVRYEAANRPDWKQIPLAAVKRIVSESES